MRSTWSVVFLLASGVVTAQDAPGLTAEALRKRAQALAKKEPQKALEDLTQALAQKPDWAEAYLDRARIRKRLGDLKGAEQDCDTALTKISGWYDALDLRGHLKRARGDLAGAVADWTAAAKAPGNWGGAQFNLGTIKLQQGDPKAAIPLFDAALKLSPQYADAYLNRGYAKFRTGDLKGAIADGDAALRLRPKWGEAYFNRGAFKVAAGDLKGAIVDFTLTLAHHKTHRDARINRARARQDLGQHAEAIEDFDHAIKARSEPELHYYRARSRWALGKVDGAVADVERARQRKRWTPPLVLLAEIQLARGKTTDAIATLTLAITNDPNDPDLFLARAQAQARQDSVAAAIQSCDGALKLQPQAQGALLLRALLRGRQGDTQRAVKDMQAFATLDGSVYGPLWVAGWTGHTAALKPFAAEKTWAGALARWALGQLDADGLLAEAKAAKTPRERRGRLCEAYGYQGLFAERSKKADQARAAYAECWKHRVPDFVEAEWARARLKALGN